MNDLLAMAGDMPLGSEPIADHGRQPRAQGRAVISRKVTAVRAPIARAASASKAAPLPRNVSLQPEMHESPMSPTPKTTPRLACPAQTGELKTPKKHAPYGSPAPKAAPRIACPTQTGELKTPKKRIQHLVKEIEKFTPEKARPRPKSDKSSAGAKKSEVVRRRVSGKQATGACTTLSLVALEVSLPSESLVLYRPQQGKRLPSDVAALRGLELYEERINQNEASASEFMSAQGGRPKRYRMAPLETWRNERLVYKRLDGSALPTLCAVVRNYAGFVKERSAPVLAIKDLRRPCSSRPATRSASFPRPSAVLRPLTNQPATFESLVKFHGRRNPSRAVRGS